MYLLDLYLSKLPVQAFIDDTFYMRPLPAIPPAAHLPWFTNSRLGKHAISKMLTNMCSEAGIEKKTNHSLRVTGATSLFEKQVPEKIVKERTGHRSLTALRMYKRTSPTQHKAVSNILAGSKMKFDEEMCEGPSAKKARVPESRQQKDEIPMMVQNCVVNVYSKGSVENVQPVQNNGFINNSFSECDSDVDLFFEKIAHLIP